jgi:hypothetical protein
MSPVHKLSQMGSLTTNKTDYPTMLANYGDFGAMQRIAYSTPTSAGFSWANIPQTYQDLMIVCYARSNNATTIEELAIQFNNDSNARYSMTWLYGNGSSALSSRTSSALTYAYARFACTGASATSGIYASSVIHILNYANTSTNKSMIQRSAADLNGSGVTNLSSWLYTSTSAISNIGIASNGGSFVSGSTFALYGVRASAA